MNGVKLKYLLTYKLSQDNIEIMFGTIRRRLGWNNNPTALEFQRAFRGILSHVGVVPSRSANILTGANDDILTVNETTDDQNSIIEKSALVDVNRSKLFSVDDTGSSMLTLSPYVQNVCCYIAGFVVRRLLPRLKCATCRELLIATSETDTSDYKGYFFLHLKNNGGLVVPSPDVVAIVQTTEQVMRRLVPVQQPVHQLSRLGQQLEESVMQQITTLHQRPPTLSHLSHQLEQSVLQELNIQNIFSATNHALETADGIDNHVFSLVRQIVRFYLDVRKHHVVNTWNLQQRGVLIRHTKNKEVLFKHQ